MEIFRYRNYQNGIREIKDQTIYFASREELNDPVIEGFLNVYWKGDEIAWNNLFRNYVCSLHQALMKYFLQTSPKDIRENAAMVDVHQFDNIPLGKILMKLGDSFLELDNVHILSSLLGAHCLRTTRDELLAYLFFLHQQSIISVLDVCVANGYDLEEIKYMSTELKRKVDSLPKISHDEYIKMEASWRRKIMYEVIISYSDFLDQLYGSTDNEQRKAWLSVIGDFPRAYVDSLENLIHPNAYIACFSKNENNNVMWGTYAENHTGVCMIYDTYPELGDEFFPIKSRYTDNESYQNKKLYQINYGGGVRDANFFTMLGRLNRKQIESWLSDQDGEKSCCLEEIYEHYEIWREGYWKCLYDRYCHKTKEWEYENEYRLLLEDTFYAYNEQASRILKYDFSCLKGVILGMKMPMEKRMEMIRVIKEKCKKEKRDNFDIYVAEYNHRRDSIAKRPLNIKGVAFS